MDVRSKIRPNLKKLSVQINFLKKRKRETVKNRINVTKIQLDPLKHPARERNLWGNY